MTRTEWETVYRKLYDVYDYCGAHHLEDYRHQIGCLLDNMRDTEPAIDPASRGRLTQYR